MAINAKKYNNDTAIQTNTFYSVDANTSFQLKEKQDDSTWDIVTCVFEELDSDNYFCLEYRPSIVAAKGHKAADIFAFSIMDSEDAINAYIYDIKRSFKADSEILHYIEQINSNYKNDKGAYESIGDNRTVIYKVGVITGNYDREKISEQARYYQKKIDEIKKESSNIAFMKNKAIELPSLRRKARVLDEVAEKKLVLEDGATFRLDDVHLIRNEEGNFVGSLYI